MTTGAWILLASLALAAAVALWRAYADGRFRGTHVITGEAAPGSGARSKRASRVIEGEAAPGSGARSERAARVIEGEAAPGVEVRAERASKPPAQEPLLPADQLGERATLLQFSSAFCAPCRATRRVLGEVAEAVPGVAHVEVDAEEHLELVRRVRVLRTPTTLVLDAHGREVTRAAGAPRKEQVLSALQTAVSPTETNDGAQA